MRKKVKSGNNEIKETENFFVLLDDEISLSDTTIYGLIMRFWIERLIFIQVKLDFHLHKQLSLFMLFFSRLVLLLLSVSPLSPMRQHISTQR